MNSMVMSRQSTSITLPDVPEVNDVRAVNAAARAVMDAITTASPEDSRWKTGGPLVSAAALRLREAIGAPVIGTSIDAPPIVRECDLATAARGLLARDAHIEDGVAASDFLRLAFKATVAFS